MKAHRKRKPQQRTLKADVEHRDRVIATLEWELRELRAARGITAYYNALNEPLETRPCACGKPSQRVAVMTTYDARRYHNFGDTSKYLCLECYRIFEGAIEQFNERALRLGIPTTGDDAR